MVAPTTRPYISAPMTRRFTRLAWTAATFTYLLIILGAIVRITGSGLGCGEHWPLCNGKLLPPLDLPTRSEEHTSELQSQSNLVCRLLLEKKTKLHTPEVEVVLPHGLLAARAPLMQRHLSHAGDALPRHSLMRPNAIPHLSIALVWFSLHL